MTDSINNEKRFDPIIQAENHLIFYVNHGDAHIKTIGIVKKSSKYSSTEYTGWSYGDSTKARDSICSEFAYKYLYS